MHLPPEMDVDKGLFINSLDFKASDKGGHSVKTIHLGSIASTGVPYYKSACLKISNIWISAFHQNNFDMFILMYLLMSVGSLARYPHALV